MKLEAYSLHSAIEAIQGDLRASAFPEVARQAVICEQLRAAALFATFKDGAPKPGPLHASNFTRAARTRLKPLWPALANPDDDTVLSELRHLGAVCDLIAVSGGWFVGPVRTIDIDPVSCLLIGGGPVHAFPSAIRTVLQVCGRARIVTKTEKSAPALAEIPSQPLADWLGLPYEDIHEWARAYTSYLNARLTPVDEHESVQVYANRRWVPLAECKISSENYLFRRVVQINGHKTNDYGWGRLGATRNGDRLVRNAVKLDRSDARRIQTSTQCHHEPEVVQLRWCKPAVALRFPHPIPDPESKVLSLGWEAPATQGATKWPREFYFPARLSPLLTRWVELLGYKIEEREIRVG